MHAINAQQSQNISKSVAEELEGKNRQAFLFVAALKKIRFVESNQSKAVRKQIREERKAVNMVKRRIASNLRKRLRDFIERSKMTRGDKLMGCTKQFLMQHIAHMFKRGMTWHNYGTVWHLDHIIPCSAFDLSDPREQLKCFHFTNLQPMFARDNILKRDKILPTQSELLMHY